MNMLQRLHWREATHHFDKRRRIPKAHLHTLLESLRLAPSAYGLQPWKFVLVKNAKIRAKLVKYSYNQSQVADASEFIVLCAKKDITKRDIHAYITFASKVQHAKPSAMSSYESMILKDVAGMSAAERKEWNAKQVYIALGFFLATAAYLGIDTCPLEGFEPKPYERILGLKKYGVVPVVCVAAGYRRSDVKGKKYKKVRFPAKDVFLLKK